MKPWFEVSGVDECAPWPLIEHAYLDKWAVLKAGAFLSEAEKEQSEEPEPAFRKARHNRREVPHDLTDASLPDGTKPVRPNPEAPKEVLPPEAEETAEDPSAAYGTRFQVSRKEDVEDSAYFSGCGLAALFIIGITVILPGLPGLGVSAGYAGLMIVFGLPFLLYFGDDLLKKRKPKR